MINRTLDFAARGCFAAAALLFLSRLSGIVTPYSQAYWPVNWAFFWAFGLAVVLADISIVRKSHPLIQARTPFLRWVYSAGKFLALLALGTAALLWLCTGMNFMGQ